MHRCTDLESEKILNLEMDIGSLLAEADKEVEVAPTYDDEFEKDDDGDDDKEPLSAREILRSAAQIVDKEEKYEVKQLFKETAVDVKEVVEKIQDEREDSGYEDDQEALNALLEADKEVSAMHRAAGVEIITPVKKKKEEIDIDAGLESDDEDEEFDDLLSQQLLQACHMGNINKVEKLLDKSGVNLLYVDRHGWTPLHWAASKGHTDIVEVLIKHRKRQGKKMRKFLEAQDKLAGWTPMHAAAVAGQKFTIEVLLEHGANKNKKDFMKEIPIEVIGKSKNAKGIINLLSDDESKRD